MHSLSNRLLELYSSYLNQQLIEPPLQMPIKFLSNAGQHFCEEGVTGESPPVSLAEAAAQRHCLHDSASWSLTSHFASAVQPV
jgi:hypothetical protein